MLSSVLRSRRAVEANIAIMRAFVSLRQMLVSHEALARKLEALEKKYDANFKVVFDAIRELMSPPPSRRTAIGFRPYPSKADRQPETDNGPRSTNWRAVRRPQDTLAAAPQRVTA